MFDFADIFRFAGKKFDIGWNQANDVFFGNSLDYGSVTDIYPKDWRGYVSFDESAKDKASDYTKEEVKEMNNYDKSYVVLAAYFEAQNIKYDEVCINCR